MIFKMNRLRTAFILLGCLFVLSAHGQDAGSAAAPAGGGQDTSGGAAGGQEAAPAGGGQAAAPASEAVPVVMPGAYGTAPMSLTPGEGRFSKPPYQFTLSMQQGFDTNVFTTASNTVSSLVNTGQLGFQMQGATPRTIFTLDSTAGINYYWHRPGVNPEDYNGNLSLLFFHKITPRMNISMTASVAYLTQPNFAALNATINQQGGSYILGSGRLNLSYQWSAKFQTNTSYSFNTTLYQEKTQQTNNIVENTFGNEWKFLLNPRTSLVAEGRYSSSSYPKYAAGDSSTLYGLLGADYMFSRRLSATIRGGLQYRNYSTASNTTGGSSAGSTAQSSPYAETTVSYIYGHQSTFQWTNRFGLDSSNIASQKVTSFRTGINFNHVLTAKMILTFGLNYNVTSTQTGDRVVLEQIIPGLIVPVTIPGTTTDQNQIYSTLGLQYTLTPKFSLTANYTFTDIISVSKANSYTRSQFFLGGAYTF
jgi:hypothetical protein